MTVRLLVASNNKKKLEELEQILRGLKVELISLKSFPEVKEVEEDGKTFKENAEKKALGFAKQSGCLTISDDSGLCVDYLEGAPGVHSARFSGPQRDDVKNCEKLLEALKGVPKEKRSASFQCAIALASPSSIVHVVEGRVDGQITEAMQGESGFGYDPLFYYGEFGKTFAQVPPEKKHRVSHRGKALSRMKEYLEQYLKEGG